MSSTRGSRVGRFRRSRYQSISERRVSRNSRISAVNRSSRSRGTARRIESSRTNIAERSKPRPSPGGRSRRYAPRSAEGSSSKSGSWSGGAVYLGSIALLEEDLQRPVLESRPARRVGRHRGWQDDSPLLPAHPDDHLQPDLLQLDVAALDER